jgi:hypothetical protein
LGTFPAIAGIVGLIATVAATLGANTMNLAKWLNAAAMLSAAASAGIDAYECFSKGIRNDTSCWGTLFGAVGMLGSAGGAADTLLVEHGIIREAESVGSKADPRHGILSGFAGLAFSIGGSGAAVDSGSSLSCGGG